MVRITSYSTLIITSLMVMLLWTGTLGAQPTSAQLSGTVWDPSDNPTSGVILTAVEESTGWQSEVVSDENGQYVFLSLRPGYYTVFTKAKGYQQITRRGIYLPINGNVSESFTLDIAAADETVGVEEPMPFNTSDVSSDIPNRDLDILPIFSRNPLLLPAYLPGIQANSEDLGGSTSNGARKAMNGVYVDGLEVTDPTSPRLDLSSVALSPDSVQAMHVITSGAKAEFGGTAGAQLGIITQTGGNAWHAGAYDYFSNEFLNANDFFRKNADYGRSKFRQNTFGATVSGPLMHNRTLIFGHYEGRRMHSTILRNRLVLMDDSDDDNDIDDDGILNDVDPDVDGDGIPDIEDDNIPFFEKQNDEARAGVFRWYTPGSSDLQEFNIVDSVEDINPQIAQTLALLQSPNNTLIGDGLNTGGYLFENPTHSHSDQMTVRIDHTLNQNHRIFLRLNWNRNDTTDVWNNADATFPGMPEGTVEQRTWGLIAGSHLILNPRMINELRIGYVRPKTDFVRPARMPQSMQLANSWTNPLNPDYSRAYITPFFELSDNFIHSRNRHTFKYGGSFRRSVQKSKDLTGTYPDITFGTGHGNNVPASIGPYGNDVISSADRQAFEYLYNDLLGRVESVTQTYQFNLDSALPTGSSRERNYSELEFSGFIQDDWKIRPDLTLNLGVRYEYFGVPDEKNDLQRILDPASGIGPDSNVSDFTFINSNQWRNRNLANFAPRAGFAWDISGYGTFVLRGSFGIFYDRPIGAITNLIDRNTYGFSQTVASYPSEYGGEYLLGSGALPTPAVPETPVMTPPATRSVSIAVLDPDLSTPRVERFNLSMERRLSNNVVFEVSLIHARGKNLYQNLNYNQTKTQGDFLQAFNELKDYRDNGTDIPAGNTLVQIFGTPDAALNAIGTDSYGVSYVDSSQAGAAADMIDLNYFNQYASAGVSEFYLRNFPQFDKLIVGTDTGRSWYDSLQAGFRANSSAFRMRAYYTWGKSLDTLSADGDSFISPSDSFDPMANKAFSDFDHKHIVNINGNFDIPIGRNRHWGADSSRVTNWIFGEWEVSFLSLWESGQRFGVNSGRQTVFADTPSLANYSGSLKIGSVQFSPFGVYWFNTDEIPNFTYPAAGESGSSGRNSFKGPDYFNIDMAFLKPFNIGDRHRLQVRAEVYNLFNTTHFGIPVNNLYDSNFGKLTSTIGTPRTIQVALKYQF